MKGKFTTNSAKETNTLAKKFASRIKKREVVGFTGDLGTGKTTFIKALLKELGVNGKIVSPTFVIAKSFSLTKNKSITKIHHIDAYRIDCKKDIIGTGIEDILKDKTAISVIEWAENIKEILPQRTIWIRFDYGEKENERHITIN